VSALVAYLFVAVLLLTGCGQEKKEAGPPFKSGEAITTAPKSDKPRSDQIGGLSGLPEQKMVVEVKRSTPTNQSAAPSAATLSPRERPRRGDEKDGVLAEGLGATPDEALKDAFRNAVRQVVGAYVNSESQIKNDQIISDEVLTFSDGFIERYEENGTSFKDGVYYKSIRAVVEKRDVLTRLRFANIAVAEVDGKGLFAEAISTLEAERAAERMLQRILNDYPATVLNVVIVSKPRVIDKSDREAKVSYDIKVGIDTSKYDQLFKRIIPLIERASVRHGIFNNIGKSQSPDKTDDERFAAYFGMPHEPRVTDRMSIVVAGSHSLCSGNLDYKREEFDLSHIDFRTQMLVLVNTGRDKLDDRTTWKWFHMPKAKIFSNNVVVQVQFEGSSHKDKFMFGRYLDPALPGLCLEADEHNTRYVGPWKLAVLSPYFLQFHVNVEYATEIAWTVETTLPLTELQKVRSLKCSALVRKPMDNVNPNQEKWND